MGAHTTNAHLEMPPTRSTEDDLRTARAAAGGDESAKRKLAETVYDRVQRTLCFISNAPDEVDDLTQNALVEVLQSVGSYRGEAPLTHWAERIAVRTAARHFEKRRRRDRLFEKGMLGLPAEMHAATDETAAYREMLRRFERLIAALGDDSRMALVLHHVRRYSVDEIAALSNCSKFTVKGRLRRARRRLKREILQDEVLAEWVEAHLDWSRP